MTFDPNNVRKKLANHILADGFEPIIDLEKSHGSYLVDHRDGSEYLDMFSMYASGSVGYNHPYIIERKNILGEIAINKTTLSDVYNIYYADFLDTFNSIGIPSYLTNAFFIEGGALAVENALKTAFDWKRRKNMAKACHQVLVQVQVPVGSRSQSGPGSDSGSVPVSAPVSFWIPVTF